MSKKILFVSDEKKDSLNFILQSLKDDKNYEMIFTSSLDQLSPTNLKEVQLILVSSPSDSLISPDLIKQLKFKNPELKIPIAVFTDTGELKREILTEFFSLGVKDFLNEKEPPEILKVKIDDILQKEKHRLQVDALKREFQSEKRDTDFDSDQTDEISKLVNEPRTWEFMYRVISEEGPLHKIKVNQCFLKILNYLLPKLKKKSLREIEPYPFETLKPDANERPQPPHTPAPHCHPHPPHPPGPPHHHPHRTINLNIPLGMPCRLLNLIYQNDERIVFDIVPHLFEGPPHEVYMNILYLHIFEQYYSLLHEGEANE